MNQEDYKIAYENVMVANKMLEREIVNSSKERQELLEENKRLKEIIEDYRNKELINFSHEIDESWYKEDYERLNNIIEKLEKWLEERLEKLDIIGYDDDVFNGLELALQKLNELKGSEMKNDKRSNN